MAIRFISPTNLTTTSHVRDITIICGSYTSVQVELRDSSNLVLYSEKLHTVDGNVALHDVGTLCEASLRKRALSYGEFRIYVTAGTETANTRLRMIYCERFIPISDTRPFFLENYLTTLPERRIPSGFSPTLHYHLEANTQAETTVALTLLDTETHETLTASTSIPPLTPLAYAATRSVTIQWSSLLAVARAAYPDRSISILHFTASTGPRSATFFVDPSLHSARTFYFRNTFNAVEAVTLPILTTAKITVEQTFATLGVGETRTCDRRATQTFEQTIGPLTISEADHLTQLIASHDTHIFEPVTIDAPDETEPFPIIITDSTCEVTDGPQPAIVKLTWRYADNRPVLHLPIPTNTFSTQFSPTYS